MHYEEDFGGGSQATTAALSVRFCLSPNFLLVSLSFFVTFLQWFLQQLPEGQRKLIHAEKKAGDSGSKGGGIINISMQKQLEKATFLKNLALNSASSSDSDVQISIFSFSNKTLHTELLRVIAKFVATTGDDVLSCNTV